MLHIEIASRPARALAAVPDDSAPIEYTDVLFQHTSKSTRGAKKYHQAISHVVWRKTVGQVVTALSGADGNGNGLIDAGDYNFWRAHFGDTAPGSGAGAIANAAVPEPTTLMLLMFAVASCVFGVCEPRRKSQQLVNA